MAGVGSRPWWGPCRRARVVVLVLLLRPCWRPCLLLASARARFLDLGCWVDVEGRVDTPRSEGPALCIDWWDDSIEWSAIQVARWSIDWIDRCMVYECMPPRSCRWVEGEPHPRRPPPSETHERGGGEEGEGTRINNVDGNPRTAQGRPDGIESIQGPSVDRFDGLMPPATDARQRMGSKPQPQQPTRIQQRAADVSNPVVVGYFPSSCTMHTR